MYNQLNDGICIYNWTEPYPPPLKGLGKLYLRKL